MTEIEEHRTGPQLRSGPLILGAALTGAGVMLLIAGVAVGGTHVFSATRRWVKEMDVPPNELARQKWAQARAAAVAGGAAWRQGTPARESA